MKNTLQNALNTADACLDLRAELWDAVAKGKDPADELTELYESSRKDGQAMRKIYNDAKNTLAKVTLVDVEVLHTKASVGGMINVYVAKVINGDPTKEGRDYTSPHTAVGLLIDQLLRTGPVLVGSITHASEDGGTKSTGFLCKHCGTFHPFGSTYCNVCHNDIAECEDGGDLTA
jgi:hypothetical protein